ncbi:MAG: radical SAM family heme chaperone HemW [Deltaproteobacteria bacterium]|nr:radical SAM family heme chaperone HemW [Deltaproteobacteria bacterium]
MRGIYVHIPFCVRKCAYCDFYSVAGDRAAIEEFRGLLVREMDRFAREHPGEAAAPADTVFFGGGTPTVLGAEALCGLLAALRERFPIDGNAEITTEANPGTVSEEDFRMLREGGFNRVSIGVQSFTPRTLETLGRIHGVEEVRAAHRDARRAGFFSIGMDLIFGIPGQERPDWTADLDRTVTFLPAHVSAYALAPERGTPIHGAIERGELRMPDDETVADMYEDARAALSRAGYRQYEISNFARPGAECRHNLKYWRREGYLGFGPSAHGLRFPPGKGPFGVRTSNPASLAEYRRRILEGRLPWEGTHACSGEDAWKESLIAGLRMLDGIDVKETESRIGPPPEPVRRAVESLLRAGKLREENSRLRLPANLLFVSNEVLQALA